MNELAELERQEKIMMEKLQESRMSSAISAQSNKQPALRSGMSPLKGSQTSNQRVYGTTQKSQPRLKNAGLDEDLNDRIDLDASIKVPNNAA